ncbi:hypothetical protein YC2023_088410 [Brassica napus]
MTQSLGFLATLLGISCFVCVELAGGGSEMALINLEAHVLLLSGGFVVLMLQSKLLFIQPDWNLTMTMEVNGGIIVSVVKEEDWFKKHRSRVKVIDYGEAVIMPGLVDV